MTELSCGRGPNSRHGIICIPCTVAQRVWSTQHILHGCLACMSVGEHIYNSGLLLSELLRKVHDNSLLDIPSKPFRYDKSSFQIVTCAGRIRSPCVFLPVSSCGSCVPESEPTTRPLLYRVYPDSGLVSHDVEHQSKKASDSGNHA